MYRFQGPDCSHRVYMLYICMRVCPCVCCMLCLRFALMRCVCMYINHDHSLYTMHTCLSVVVAITQSFLKIRNESCACIVAFYLRGVLTSSLSHGTVCFVKTTQTSPTATAK